MTRTRTEVTTEKDLETSHRMGEEDDFVDAKVIEAAPATRSDLSTPTDFRLSTSATPDKIGGRMAPMGPEPMKAGPTDQ